MTQESSVITLAILEDNAGMLNGLQSEFDRPGYRVCVAADEVPDFLDAAVVCQPDVALIDIRIWAGLDAGLAVIEKLRDISPGTRFVVYTVHDSMENFHRAFMLGVEAFVCKERDVRPEVELFDIVKMVAQGMNYYPSDILERYKLAMQSFQPGPATEVSRNDASPVLSEREREVLTLVSQGLNQQEIAEALVISLHTVKSHTSNIRDKLNVGSTMEAFRVARLKGLI